VTAVSERVTDPRALAALRADRELALDALTAPTKTRIEHDDGTSAWGEVASLLDQLAEAVTTPSGAAGSFTARSKPPCYVDALSLLAEIETTCGVYERQTLAGQVRAWALATPIVEATDTVTRWASMARTMLDPRSRRRVRGTACPACGARRVFDARDDATGEVHFRPPLEVDTDAGECRCTNPRCDAVWPAERWALLAEVLEQQRDEQDEEAEAS
jgi:hypothetical protein